MAPLMSAGDSLREIHCGILVSLRKSYVVNLKARGVVARLETCFLLVDTQILITSHPYLEAQTRLLLYAPNQP